MRVLVVTTWFPDAEHPSRTPFVLEHVRAIRDAGHDVRVLHVRLGRPGPSSSEDQDLPVRRVGFGPRRPLRALASWRELRVALGECDVLHTMAFSSALVAAGPWLTRRRPWVHTEHWNGVSAPASVPGAWPRVAWLRHVLRLPHRVTGVTAQLVERMSPFTRTGAGSVVPCVVTPPSHLAALPPRPPLRLVAVGLLNGRKDPHLALETLAWLRDRGHDVRLTWVGTGPLADEVGPAAERLGVADAVRFVGAVPPAEVSDHLGAAHLFFLPSHQENFFTAVAEAITAGRPAVVPLSGGFDDYCTTANSVLVASWDVEVLAAAVLRAAETFADATPSDVAGTLGDRFSRAEIGRRFTELYEEARTA